MRKLLTLFLSIFLFSGCTSEEPEKGSSDDTSIDIEYIYLEFNRWIYAEMNRNYLWRQDMPDSLDCNYDLFPKDFFQNLLSPHDRFSYFTTNPGYAGRSENLNPGFAYQEYRDNLGNTAWNVLYVISPDARQAGLSRGDWVKPVSISSPMITLRRIELDNNSFKETNQDLQFSIADIVGKQNTVLLDSIYYLSKKNIGYLCYLEFGNENDLRESLMKFKENQISELILDLRYNPGGYVNTCKYLCNCIVSSVAYGNVFQENSYNDILSEYYHTTTGSPRTYYYFEFPQSSQNTLGAPIYGLDLNRIIVLTSKNTASASEALIMCMKPYMEVVTIGETTLGKGVGSRTLVNSNYPYALQPIVMRYHNVNHESTPDDGIVPDLFLEGGYFTPKKDIGDTDEPLLKAALSYIKDDCLETSIYSTTRTDELSFVSIAKPSFVTEYNKKQYNEYR